MDYEDKINIYYQILDEAIFYTDESNSSEVFVEYENLDGIWTFEHVHSPKFEAYLRESFRIEAKGETVPSFQYTLQEYIDKAILNENTVKILYRMGGDSNETAYYLADKKNTVFIINKDGCKRYNSVKKYKFLKTNNSARQVIPKVRNELLEELDPFINMEDGMKVLFAVNLVQQFINSAHFLAVVSSEQGSGKSTFCKIWRQIVDPAKAIVTTMPDNVDGLKNHLGNHLMVVIDNAQPLNTQFSDVLCGAITGSTYVKRKLYTDTDEIVKELRNIVIVNGIDIIPRKSDLLERSLIFKLKKIPDEQRKGDREIEDRFKEALPYILGAVFKTLIRYFKIKDKVKVEGNHRMSQAYKDCYIIATILGVKNEFLRAFNQNQEELQKSYSEANPLISAITDYMADNDRIQIEMSVSEWFNALLPYVDKKSFPKSPSAFSRELNSQKEIFAKAGFEISLSKTRTHTALVIKKKKGKK